MRKAFYSRLALTNIHRNKNIYVPYLLAGALITALYYILRSVAVMVEASGMEGAGHMFEMLTVSANVCGALSLVVLFYINSFVMKRRGREFGLYSILGMGKRHISLVLAWEVLITASVSIAGGIAGGAVLSQLLFLLLLRLVRAPVSLTFQIPFQSVLSTALLFCAGFAAVLVFDAVYVWRSSPSGLLRSASQGEREPKARWILAAAGAGLLLGGYLTAWSAKSPYDAMNLFMPAVLLVIAGTFLTFLAGSIALLKLLRRNRRFYYKPGNFIAVSGMLYRMKQNAMGLANICILSTCVLVTLSSTVCLFWGEEDLLRANYPRAVHIECRAEGAADTLVQETAEAHAAENGFAVTEAEGYHSFRVPAGLGPDGFIPNSLYTADTYDVTCLVLEEYNRLTGGAETLQPGEILAGFPEGAAQEQFVFGGLRRQVKGAAQLPELLQRANGGISSVVAVFPSQDALYAMKAETDAAGLGREYHIWFDYWYDISGEADSGAFFASLGTAFQAVPQIGLVESITSARNDFYQVYGSLLFVGIFFVTLFLITTVLIIYYKQVTEGFDDRERFQIMEKVGMSGAEVRRTIRKQVLLVFFLPLGMAMMHIAAAFPALRMLLLVFGMDNAALFGGCVLGAALAFSALYFAVYRLTARTYFRIVHAAV